MFEYDIQIEIKCPDCGQANCNGMGLWKKSHEPLTEKPEWLKKKDKEYKLKKEGKNAIISRK